VREVALPAIPVGRSAQNGRATAGGTTLAMQYDVDGRRVQLSASGVITNYLWDTTTRYGDVLLETGTSGAFKTSYVYGNACGSGCSRNPVAELISQKRGANPREYYLLDGQGSVRGLTDGTNGTLTQEYAYDTAGSLTSGDATKSAYLYTGQQYDAATELYSLRARYYSPQQGRFLSRDKWPVDYKNPVELNRYGYTANNPVNWSDPSGNGIALDIAYVAATTLVIYPTMIATVIGQYYVASILALTHQVVDTDWNNISDLNVNYRICSYAQADWTGVNECSIIFARPPGSNVSATTTVINWLQAAAGGYAGFATTVIGGISAIFAGPMGVAFGAGVTGGISAILTTSFVFGTGQLKDNTEGRIGVKIRRFPPSISFFGVTPERGIYGL
jgi:RHS repeat-associated protein